MQDAGRVCQKAGCVLLCENAFPRIDRGAGIPAATRVPYFPREAHKEMSKYKTIVFVGARVPVAMFGYADGISALVDEEAQNIITVDTHDPVGALRYLARIMDCGGKDALYDAPAIQRPKRPRGKLTADKMCAAIALFQPENAIIIDESLTSGTSYWRHSSACPPFSHLTLTGGAIGSGPPLAVGAAVACPNRRVINIQADGSGLYSLQVKICVWWCRSGYMRSILLLPLLNVCMYECMYVCMCASSISNECCFPYAPCSLLLGSLLHSSRMEPTQALWTQARERLPVVTIICANAVYNILKVEQQKQDLSTRRSNAQSLTNLGDPRMDWCHLAKGFGVDAARAETAEELMTLLAAALESDAPFLIEAML
jgi:thiamine pyrophosphate-dependent acetolactate synthase large subunit-like protein